MCWAGNAAAVSRARCARSAGLRRTRIPKAIFRLSSGARTQQDGAYRMAGEVAAAFSAYGLANTHHTHTAYAQAHQTHGTRKIHFLLSPHPSKHWVKSHFSVKKWVNSRSANTDVASAASPPDYRQNVLSRRKNVLDFRRNALNFPLKEVCTFLQKVSVPSRKRYLYLVFKSICTLL